MTSRGGKRNIQARIVFCEAAFNVDVSIFVSILYSSVKRSHELHSPERDEPYIRNNASKRRMLCQCVGPDCDSAYPAEIPLVATARRGLSRSIQIGIDLISRKVSGSAWYFLFLWDTILPSDLQSSCS